MNNLKTPRSVFFYFSVFFFNKMTLNPLCNDQYRSSMALQARPLWDSSLTPCIAMPWTMIACIMGHIYWHISNINKIWYCMSEPVSIRMLINIHLKNSYGHIFTSTFYILVGQLNEFFLLFVLNITDI